MAPPKPDELRTEPAGVIVAHCQLNLYLRTRDPSHDFFGDEVLSLGHDPFGHSGAGHLGNAEWQARYRFDYAF